MRCSSYLLGATHAGGASKVQTLTGVPQLAASLTQHARRTSADIKSVMLSAILRRHQISPVRQAVAVPACCDAERDPSAPSDPPAPGLGVVNELGLLLNVFSQASENLAGAFSPRASPTTPPACEEDQVHEGHRAQGSKTRKQKLVAEILAK
jgi:hypothetical protein